jgi:hypothetical protein
MDVRNRDGDAVDAVPFLVLAGILGMLTLSVGPLYGLAYGVPVGRGVGISVAATAVLWAASFHQLVWSAPPEWVTVPADVRFQQLFYFAIAFGAVLVGLSLPLAL